ncbi:quercetin 2,3-dioxygenase [Psychrobacter sp. B38]|uniref:quercetin 2,3-dioxygenase n=1 Tax=Psychrobacter sp. B38 TaxID=3143538 RepID=UPI00320F8D1C
MFNRNTIMTIAASLLFSTIASAQVTPYPETPVELLRKGKTIKADIQKVVPKETLPGEKIPYISRSDRGERYLVNGTIVNYMARAKDTGDMYEIATITGGKGAGQPVHHHCDHFIALYLMEGEADLWLNGEHFLMRKGDFASVPANTDYGFRFNRHRTKMLAWYSGPGLLDTYKALGEPTDLYIQPDHAKVNWSAETIKRGEAAGDITFAKDAYPQGKAKKITRKELPKKVIPYTIAADEGRKFVGGPEYFSMLASQQTTGGRFFVVITQAPQTPMVPRHYHALHSENFFGLEGEVDLIVNHSKATLKAGDLAAVPAGTIHAYSMTQPYNRFIGFLTPGLFQNFFEILGDAGYDANVYPAKPHELRFDRVIKELESLDLHIVEDDMRAEEAAKK